MTDEFMRSMRGKKIDWVFEYKPGNSGGKIYSHTMCIPCHRQVDNQTSLKVFFNPKMISTLSTKQTPKKMKVNEKITPNQRRQ